MRSYIVLLLLLFTTMVQAEGLNLTVELPRLPVAEYHKPYVSAWVEDDAMQVVAPLLLWYGMNMPKEEGKEWLKDMRLWWRRIGRSTKLPLDGATGATRGPGQHTLNFAIGKAPLPALAEGQYTLVVEAVREVGGREVLKIPFSWPADQGQVLQAQGQYELGDIRLNLKTQ